MTVPDRSRLLRRSALDQGLSDDEPARMVRRGELVRLQRGAYLEAGTSADDRLRLVATVAGLRVPGVVGHASPPRCTACRCGGSPPGGCT